MNFASLPSLETATVQESSIVTEDTTPESSDLVASLENVAKCCAILADMGRAHLPSEACQQIAKMHGSVVRALEASRAKAQRELAETCAELAAQNDLLCEALPYVEESEQFSKPNSLKLSVRIRAKL